MNSKKKGYEEAVRYLYSLQKYGIKFGLSKTSNLLRALGNPHKGQKYIHIGGTNGKGSVAAFIASILEETGLRVGLYTSPHLVRFTERFRINSVEITQQKAADLIEELIPNGSVNNKFPGVSFNLIGNILFQVGNINYHRFFKIIAAEHVLLSMAGFYQFQIGYGSILQDH